MTNQALMIITGKLSACCPLKKCTRHVTEIQAEKIHQVYHIRIDVFDAGALCSKDEWNDVTLPIIFDFSTIRI